MAADKKREPSKKLAWCFSTKAGSCCNRCAAAPGLARANALQYAWDRHDRFSVLGALSLAPWALRIGLYFRLFDHNITAADLVEFIKQLHRQLGRRLILVWDRWSVHRSAAKQLAHYDWLQVAYLPAYARS